MFSCTMPGKVYCGSGAIGQLAALCGGRGTVAVLTDQGVASSGTLEPVLEVLKQADIPFRVLDDIPTEPACEQAQAVVDAFRALDAGMILAVGGGSVMDVAKICSVTAGATVRTLVDNPSAARKTIPTVMAPTTAGTGAETTPNAIVALPEKALKVGIVSAEMIPDAVVLDETLLRRLPARVAASTGVDALCHAVECYTSLKATPFSDLFALEAARLIFSNLEAACLEPDAAESRSAMLLGAFYAGEAIACSGTTAVHALSYPLGGRYHIPHGVANAMLLLPVMRYNLPACTVQFAAICDALGEGGQASEEDKAHWLLERMEQLVGALGIPTSLKQYGVGAEELDSLVEDGMGVTRLLNNNRRPVTREAARAIYQELLT